MADNITVTESLTGSALAADDVSSVKWPGVKVAHGADGSASYASYAAPLPVAACGETSQVLAGGTVCTPKFAVISGASSGDNTVINAVSSKKIRVLALYAVAAGSTTVRFESGASGTALTGVVSLVANTGFVLPYNPVGWFETGTNTLLNMELNAAVQVSGCCTYVEV